MDDCFGSGLSIGFGYMLDDIDTGYLLVALLLTASVGGVEE